MDDPGANCMSSRVSATKGRSSAAKGKSNEKGRKNTSISSSRRSIRRTKIEPSTISRCVNCGSKRIVRKEVEVRVPSRKITTVDAEVCLTCGEKYFSRAAAEKILATPVDDVRRVRTKLSKQTGNDIQRLANHAHAAAAKLRDRLGLKQAK